MAATHRYETQLSWSGSTAGGYRDYGRDHRVDLAEGPIAVSSDASFLGNPELTNPEQLVLAAASSCQLLSFLALAARAGIDVRSYSDRAEAVMPAARGRMRITEIVLDPAVEIASH